MATTFPLREHDFTNWKKKATYRPSLRLSLMLSAASSSSTRSASSPRYLLGETAVRQETAAVPCVVGERVPVAAIADTSTPTQRALAERIRQLEEELRAARQQVQVQVQSPTEAAECEENTPNAASAEACEFDDDEPAEEAERRDKGEERAHSSVASPSAETPAASSSSSAVAAPAAAAVAHSRIPHDTVTDRVTHEAATQATELAPAAVPQRTTTTTITAPHETLPRLTQPPVALSSRPPVQGSPTLRQHPPSPSPPPPQRQPEQQAQVARPLQLRRSSVPQVTLEQLHHDVRCCADEIERLVEDQHELRCSMHEVLAGISMLGSLSAEASQLTQMLHKPMQDLAGRSGDAVVDATPAHVSATPAPSKVTTSAEPRDDAAVAVPPPWLMPLLDTLRTEQAAQLQQMREEMLVLLCHTVADVRRASSASPPPVREMAARVSHDVQRRPSYDSRSSDSESFLTSAALAAPLLQQPRARMSVVESGTSVSGPPHPLLLQRHSRLLSSTPPDARSVHSNVALSSASVGGLASLKRHDALWTALLAVQEAVQAQSAQLTRLEGQVVSQSLSASSAAPTSRLIEAPPTSGDVAASSGTASARESASPHRQPHHHHNHHLHPGEKGRTAHALTAEAASPPPRQVREHNRLLSPPRDAAATTAAAAAGAPSVKPSVASSVKTAHAGTSAASTRTRSRSSTTNNDHHHSRVTDLSATGARQHRPKHRKQLETIHAEVADLRLLLQQTLVQNRAEQGAPPPMRAPQRQEETAPLELQNPPLSPTTHQAQPAAVVSPTSNDVSHLRSVSDYPSSLSAPVAGSLWGRHDASGSAHHASGTRLAPSVHDAVNAGSLRGPRVEETHDPRPKAAAAEASAQSRQRMRTTLTSSLVYPPA